MRVCIALVPILATSIVAADPDPAPPQVAPEPPPPVAPAPGPPAAAPAPAPPPAAPAPPPAPVVSAPAGSALPPITITITNNNNGNNSNTVTQSNTAPVSVSTPVNVSTPVTVSAPALAPPAFAPRAVVERYELSRREPPARWLMIGATLGKDGGARASIDLLSFHRIALGIAGEIDGGLGRHGHGGFERGRGGRGDGTASGEAYLAWTGKLGRLDLRAEVGAGIGGASTSRDRGGLPMRGDQPVARTTMGTTTQPMPPDRGPRDGHAPDLAPRAQAALLLGLPLGHELGIVAGPEISSDLQRRGGAEVTVFAGLRYSL